MGLRTFEKKKNPDILRFPRIGISKRSREIQGINKIPGFDLTTHDLYFTTLVEVFKIVYRTSITFTFCLIKSLSHDQSQSTNIFHS